MFYSFAPYFMFEYNFLSNSNMNSCDVPIINMNMALFYLFSMFSGEVSFFM